MLRPLLHATDRLRLHIDFLVTKDSLYDQGIDVHHRLTSKGLLFCRFLQEWQLVTSIHTFCMQHNISENEMNDSLTFLHSIGAFKQNHTSFWRYSVVRLRYLVYGVRFAAPVWRQPASIYTILIGVLRASLAVIAALFVLFVLMWSGGLLNIQAASLIFVYTTSMLVGSIYLHELAHYMLLPDQRQSRFMQQGLRCGLAHKPLHGRRALYTTLSGPLVGFSVCIMAVIWTTKVAQPFTYIAFLTSLIHLFALLPWYGDGRALKQYLIQQRASL